MLLSCFYSTDLGVMDRLLRLRGESREILVEPADDYTLLTVVRLGARTEGIAFPERGKIVLALKSHKADILNSALEFLNHILNMEPTDGFREYKFPHRYFKNWLHASSQILECTFIVSEYTKGSTKLSGSNLLESDVFERIASESTIIRMMFTFKGHEKYLITAKETGKVIINPDPDNSEAHRVLKLLLTQTEVTLA